MRIPSLGEMLDLELVKNIFLDFESLLVNEVNLEFYF